ncbi:MAG: ribosomal L7Ae/L30e/S12e/Gadd45 family protein [archaeon]
MSIADIKKLLGKDKLLFGADRALKSLRKGLLEKVYIASNTKEETKKSIIDYAKLSGAKVEELKIPNDELGTACRKPFSISVIGVLK